MVDDLGNRMKEFYEERTRTFLPRRTYTIIRIDGKAFHTYTKGMKRPFDEGFIEDMDETAKFLCKEIQGAKLAFVQSDEISIVMTDFDKLSTDAWYNGAVQKICSVSASLATAKFNQLRLRRATLENIPTFAKEFEIDLEIIESKGGFRHKSRALQSQQRAFNEQPIAMFDARVFTIPFVDEVFNYLIWRQQDTVRNSIQSLAQSLYSHKQLEGKNSSDLQEMCFQKGSNWNDLDPKLKRGRLIIKESFDRNGAQRTRWVSTAPKSFSTPNKFLITNILGIG